MFHVLTACRICINSKLFSVQILRLYFPEEIVRAPATSKLAIKAIHPHSPAKQVREANTFLTIFFQIRLTVRVKT